MTGLNLMADDTGGELGALLLRRCLWTLSLTPPRSFRT